jgi:hypothetical protein
MRAGLEQRFHPMFPLVSETGQPALSWANIRDTEDFSLDAGAMIIARAKSSDIAQAVLVGIGSRRVPVNSSV